MLDQRRRRWADVVQTLYKCFVFAGFARLYDHRVAVKFNKPKITNNLHELFSSQGNATSGRLLRYARCQGMKGHIHCTARMSLRHPHDLAIETFLVFV